MIKVSTPDGKTVEFPPGTDTATIESVMRSSFGGPKAETKPQMGMMESLGRGISEGATFGFDDKLGMSKEARETSKKANPWTHFGGEIIGGIATAAVPQLAAARLAQVGGKAAGVVRGMLAPLVAGETATVGQAAVQGAKLGASYGAISGAGHADDGNAAQGAVEGGILGGAFGGVLGPAAYKVGEKYQIAKAARNEMANADTASLSAIDRSLARDRIDPATLRAQIEVPQYGKLPTDKITELAERVGRGEALTDAAQAVGISEAAARKAVSAFEAQNATPLSIVDRARLTGVAGGENTSWTLRAGMASPGQGRAVAAENLTQRQMDQPHRIVSAVDDLVAAGDPAKRAKAMQDAERQAYGNAYAQEKPFDISPTIGGVEGQYAGRSTGIAKEMQDAAQLFSEKTPGRPPTFEPFKRLDHFQEAKLDLDQKIAQSMNMGRPTPLTKRLMDMKRQLMDEVSKTNPEWRKANDMFAENAAARRLFGDAETHGFRITPDTKREIATIEGLRKTLGARGATPEAKKAAKAQLEMYKDGLGEAVKAIALNKSETGDHVSKLLTPAGQQIITAALGKKDAAAFIKVLRQEEAITRSYRGLGGSQTTPLREAIDELNGPALLASGMDMLNPRALLNALITKGAAKLSEARNNRMVPMLTESDPLKQLGMLRDIETMRKARVTGGTSGVRYVPALSNAGQDQARPAPRGMIR